MNLNFEKFREKIEREGGGEGKGGGDRGKRGVGESERQERQVMRAEWERSVQNTLWFGMEPVHVMS